MNQTTTIYPDHPRSTVIDPYYIKGDVFQRDSRYYDQTIGTRRNRTPNKTVYQQPTYINNNSMRMSNQANTNTILPVPPITTNNQSLPIRNTIISQNQQQVIPPQSSFLLQQQQQQIINDPQQLRRLQQQHQLLLNQLQQLSSGSSFGTGETVMKKHHYIANRAQNTQILEQEQRIRSIQDQIKRNNQKLVKYQKASNQLQIRMNNIQAIDKQIYKQLKSASTRDKELLERANGALLRGEPKENVLRILQQIVI